MLEQLFWWLAAAFVAAVALGVCAFFLARWTFTRTAERVSRTIERTVGPMTARSLTHIGAYARASGIDFAEAERRFGRSVGRVARLMDSAVTIPLVGPVGLDALLGLIPGIGDLIGGAISLLLIGRSVSFGPPAALVSRMLANVLTDVILGSIPLLGIPVDIWFRANDRNAALMREFLDSRGRG